MASDSNKVVRGATGQRSESGSRVWRRHKAGPNDVDRYVWMTGSEKKQYSLPISEFNLKNVFFFGLEANLNANFIWP